MGREIKNSHRENASIHLLTQPFPQFDIGRRALATTAELESAFDAAIAQARKSIRAGMKVVGGEQAAPYLPHWAALLALPRPLDPKVGCSSWHAILLSVEHPSYEDHDI
jgi:hypothetical protein